MLDFFISVRSCVVCVLRVLLLRVPLLLFLVNGLATAVLPLPRSLGACCRSGCRVCVCVVVCVCVCCLSVAGVRGAARYALLAALASWLLFLFLFVICASTTTAHDDAHATRVAGLWLWLLFVYGL